MRYVVKIDKNRLIIVHIKRCNICKKPSQIHQGKQSNLCIDCINKKNKDKEKSSLILRSRLHYFLIGKDSKEIKKLMSPMKSKSY